MVKLSAEAKNKGSQLKFQHEKLLAEMEYLMKSPHTFLNEDEIKICEEKLFELKSMLNNFLLYQK